MEEREQRRSISRQAYLRWTKERQEQDAILMKERMKEKETECLKAAERREQRKKASESFQSWKRVKDEELRLQRRLPEEPLWTFPSPSRGKHPQLTECVKARMQACWHALIHVWLYIYYTDVPVKLSSQAVRHLFLDIAVSGHVMVILPTT